jgi:putative transposase
MMLSGVKELAPTVGIARACEALGVPRSSFYHAQQPPTPSAAPQPHPPSPRALSAAECAQIRDLLNSERFVDCEEAHGLRHPARPGALSLLLAHDLSHPGGGCGHYLRRAQRQHPIYTRPELLASAPCQVWSWDITKLRGPLPGLCYNLYVILDIFSRKIVGLNDCRARRRLPGRIADRL